MYQWLDSQLDVFSICLILRVNLEIHPDCLFPLPSQSHKLQHSVFLQETSLCKTASLHKINPLVTSLGQVVSSCATIHFVFQWNTVNISFNCNFFPTNPLPEPIILLSGKPNNDSGNFIQTTPLLLERRIKQGSWAAVWQGA